IERYMYINEYLISLDDAEKNIIGIIFQYMIINIPFLIVFILSLRKGLKLYWSFPDTKIRLFSIILLITVYLILLFYGFGIIGNKVRTIFFCFFYLCFVSLCEEFLFRGFMPALLDGTMPKWLVWIIPNLLFSLVHFTALFVTGEGFSDLSAGEVLYVIFSFTFFGIVMEFLKRYGRTIWIPILAHAIYDFYAEITMWIE
ncbi:MAG: CPBP family intramembrane metalloprotease, partial [Ruminococcus sp.]|nr:CPBP family intramembrane metalloprotease [Ruminococcus sp.]